MAKQTTIGVVAILFIAIIVFSSLTFFHVNKDIKDSIAEKNSKIEYLIIYQQQQLDRSLQGRLLRLLSDSYLVESFADRDKERLETYCSGILKSLETEYGAGIIIHFHDIDGKSFFRIHAPGYTSGAEFSRDMINHVAETKEPTGGFDIGCFGLHYRYAYPVYYMGVYIGILEMGVGAEYLLATMNKITDLESGITIPNNVAENMCVNYLTASSEGNSLLYVSNEKFIDLFNNRLPKGNLEVDGKYFQVNNTHFLSDYKGRRLASLVTFQDITFRKRAIFNYILLTVIVTAMLIAVTVLLLKNSFVRLISSLERSYELSKNRENYLGEIISNSLNEIYVYEADTLNFVEVNRGACENLGYTPEEIIGKTTLYIKPFMGEEELRERLRPVIDGSENTVVFETYHKRKDGSVYPVEIHLQRTAGTEKVLIAAIVLDITQRKEDENQLRTLNEVLEKKVELETERRLFSEKLLLEQKKFIDMGQMINAVAHQWRQPLNALGLFIQDIRETYNYGSLNEEYIQSTEEQCMNLVKHMSETIDDFRRFFAPNKKSMPFEMVWAVVETLKLVSAQLSSNSISFRVMCACGRKCFITENEIKDPDCKMRSSAIIGYEGEFKQVLLNLIHNTKDALEDRRRREGVPFDAFIDFAINVGKDEVTLEIKDNGGGIPPEVMPKIFDPYFTTKEEGKGTGIGLFMSRNIVEQHMKGHIYAESNGEFTTFVLKFRRAGDVNVP